MGKLGVHCRNRDVPCVVGAPSVNTLRNLLLGLDTPALEAAFRHPAASLLPLAESGRRPLVGLDGKTLKGSLNHLEDRKAAQALTAFASDAAILLAQTDIADKDSGKGERTGGATSPSQNFPL